MAKQESAPGGIVDIVTNALAKSAKVQEQKVANRQRVETKVKVAQAARKAAIESSRRALNSGLNATRDLSPEQSKKELQAAASAPIDVSVS